MQDWNTSSTVGVIRCVVDSENNYSKVYRVVYSNTDPLNQESHLYTVSPPALLNEGETIVLPALSTKFNDYEVREGNKVVTKYFHSGWLVNGRHFDFGDSYVAGADGVGSTEVEIIPEWTKFCKIEYVCTPPYPGAAFYSAFPSFPNNIHFVKLGERYSLPNVQVAVMSSPVKIAVGLLVNGIRYNWGDEMPVFSDIKVEPCWANVPESSFASTNLKLSNSGAIDATLIFASEGETGTLFLWDILRCNSVTLPGFTVNGVSIASPTVADYDRGRVIHSVSGLKRGVGDICRLVGIPLNEINAKLAAGILPDNGTWRLPTANELAALLHPFQDSSQGRVYSILNNTFFPYNAKYGTKDITYPTAEISIPHLPSIYAWGGFIRLGSRIAIRPYASTAETAIRCIRQ